MISQITRVLFGYDFFLSYSHSDGKRYAQVLERDLAAADCVAFRDESEHGQGLLLELWLKLSIRRSSAIVIIGTEGAIQSAHVQREIQNAIAWKKQLIPIDLMGVRKRWPAFDTERVWIEDPEASVPPPAGPSPRVVVELSAKLRHDKKNLWTRHLIASAGVLVVVLSAIAVWQWRRALAETAIAQEQRAEALRQKGIAERQARIAIEQRNVALARQLASDSIVARGFNANGTVPALLGIESLHTAETVQGYDALWGATRGVAHEVARLVH
jgi:hypothetical protein